MNPTQHPTNNRVLGAPANWDHSRIPCGALAITVLHEGDGVQLVSFWRPTEAEKQAIAAGALIQLNVFNTSHPVVAIGVEGVRYATEEGKG